MLIKDYNFSIYYYYYDDDDDDDDDHDHDHVRKLTKMADSTMSRKSKVKWTQPMNTDVLEQSKPALRQVMNGEVEKLWLRLWM